MHKSMQNVGIDGTDTDGRGGQDLYGSAPWERARGRMCEKSVFKRVIKGGLPGLLIF